MSAFWPTDDERSAGVTRVAMRPIVAAKSSVGPDDAPDAPQRGRVRCRIAVDEEEVGRPALPDDAGLGFAEQLAAPPRRGAERFPRFEPGRDERLDLPCELVRPSRASAKVGAGGDRDLRSMSDRDGLLRPLEPGRDR